MAECAIAITALKLEVARKDGRTNPMYDYVETISRENETLRAQLAERNRNQRHITWARYE